MALIADLIANLFRLLRNLLTFLGRPPEYVVVDISGSYPERRAPRPRFQPFRGALPFLQPPPEESLEDLRGVLDRVAHAPQVRGVVVRIGELPVGLATVQSLRDVLLALRRRGKRVVAYLTTISTPRYYLAAAADEILLPESAMVGFTGLRTEVTFIREALDRLGIAPEFDHIAEYKTAADRFLRREMSPAHREMVDAILDAQLDQIIEDIAAARRLTREAVRVAVDRAPFSAPEALAPGLGAGVSPLPRPLCGRQTAGSSTLARAFRAAERAPRVHAVVFSVDSGGGSALASDLIWREVERVKRRKPVVAFMGDVAGSGGYYVACGANRIIAQPGTITGSIGVVSGKLVLADLFERHGLHHEILSRGAAATIDSPFVRYDETGWTRVRQEMQQIYERFIGRVSQGRSRPAAEIEAIARGRVWTGRQAVPLGLVDELGDFTVAVQRARELAGIPAGREINVITVRPPRVAPVPAFRSAVDEMVAGLRQVLALAAERVLLLMEAL